MIINTATAEAMTQTLVDPTAQPNIGLPSKGAGAPSAGTQVETSGMNGVGKLLLLR
jgi:hypothetical protein